MSTLKEIYADMEKFKNPNGSGRFIGHYPDLRIFNFKMVPYPGTNLILYSAEAESYSSHKSHVVYIQFSGITSSENQSKYFPIKVNLQNKDFYFRMPDINDKVRLRCDCSDFYFRWMHYLNKNDSLYQREKTQYQRKTLTRPSMNPNKTCGFCKHIWAFLKYLDDSNLAITR